MKKTIAIFTLCLMLISCLPALASTSGDFTYETNDEGGVTITGYTGKAANLTVPAQLGGQDVTRIASGAFDNRYIQNVTISEGIRTIECFAFSCNKLNSISIPKSVENIESAFVVWSYKFSSVSVAAGNQRYAEIDGVLFEKPTKTLHTYPPAKKGNKYEIPKGIVFIGSQAFTSNQLLTSIVIPDSVISIGNSAFEYSKNLKRVDFPDSIRRIDTYAFHGSENLLSIYIPSQVETIGHGAFRDCKKLPSIDVASNNDYFKSVDGVLYSKDGKKMLAYPRGKTGTSYTVLNGTEIIGGGAFEDCKKLKTITIPQGVTEIQTVAFGACTNLETVILPDTLVSIEDSAFLWCEHLKNINLPDSLISIEGWAFNGCSSLRKLAIPQTVSYIGDKAFEDCKHLTVSVGAGSYAEEYCRTNNVKYEIDPALSTKQDTSWLTGDDTPSDKQDDLSWLTDDEPSSSTQDDLSWLTDD